MSERERPTEWRGRKREREWLENYGSSGSWMEKNEAFGPVSAPFGKLTHIMICKCA